MCQTTGHFKMLHFYLFKGQQIYSSFFLFLFFISGIKVEQVPQFRMEDLELQT